MTKAITDEQLKAWERLAETPACRMAGMALSKTDINAVSYVPAAAWKMRHTFSVEIPTMKATQQAHSGRCWLFAATNVLRENVAGALNLEQFELSQSYLAFWDKFERCNYFLECMLELADRPTDDRTVSFLLQTGVHDGGQWDMFAAIVKKYGLVPKDVYDETYQCTHTNGMNQVLNRNLKGCAAKLRRMAARGESEEAIQAEKNEMLGKVYAFLCACYGEPPKQFDFAYVDKDKEYHMEKGLTPLAFYEKYAAEQMDKLVCIINAPTRDKPWHEMFTVRYLGNVVGGEGVRYLNLPLDEFKQAVIAQLQAGKVVWFGSDVGKHGERDLGVWDDQSYHAELLTGLDLHLSKEDALDYGFSAMNHAMVLTGVNLEDGRPTRWKIENSWGDEHGQKGYYICSDTWFDQYVFQAAVEREYLGDLAANLAKKPIELSPWDPMGTLAD